MSDPVQAERAAFRELESVVRALAEELAGFRRRALSAEARVRELEAPGEGAPEGASPAARLVELEAQNAALAKKVEQAAERARQMQERLRFLRQQAKNGGEK